jgi:hypothetical protein
MRALLTVLAALLTSPLQAAASQVTLKGEVFVERSVSDPDGRSRIILEAPKLVAPGDRLVFILSYSNRTSQPAADFVVTNPVPPAVAYLGAPHPGTEVSVDGGRTWGDLARLKIRESEGAVRGARPEDVTHVRWTLKQPVPAGARGRLSFRGIVR